MEGVSKHKALRHYVWGEKCDCWSLVEEANLSICIKNTEDLEFLLCSLPSTNSDRINCE
jgi:hypothetical protein